LAAVFPRVFRVDKEAGYKMDKIHAHATKLIEAPPGKVYAVLAN
jgi:hypothetical protein